MNIQYKITKYNKANQYIKSNRRKGFPVFFDANKDIVILATEQMKRHCHLVHPDFSDILPAARKYIILKNP